MTSATDILRFHVYGDTFARELIPLLEEKLIEVRHQVTVNRGTIKRLSRKVFNTYRRMSEKDKYTNNTALLMIGLYDILKFKNNVWRFVSQMKRSVSALVSFLSQYHKRIIVLTTVPALKKQGLKKHWQLVKGYNRHIRVLAADPKIKVVDVFPLFLKTTKPQSCDSDLYVHEKTMKYTKRDIDVLWNNVGIRKALPCILDAVKQADEGTVVKPTVSQQ